jgi:predicted TIM-barrel fold metal-dependent hydrolase
VVDLANGLPDWIAVTRRILDTLSESEARAIASGTATSVYRLG